MVGVKVGVGEYVFVGMDVPVGVAVDVGVDVGKGVLVADPVIMEITSCGIWLPSREENVTPSVLLPTSAKL